MCDANERATKHLDAVKALIVAERSNKSLIVADATWLDKPTGARKLMNWLTEHGLDYDEIGHLPDDVTHTIHGSKLLEVAQ